MHKENLKKKIKKIKKTNKVGGGGSRMLSLYLEGADRQIYLCEFKPSLVFWTLPKPGKHVDHPLIKKKKAKHL